MKFTGWGRYPRIYAQGLNLEDANAMAPLFAGKKTAIVHAMGRSYGDSALSRCVILTRNHNRLLNFDPKAGILTCQSGVTLKQIIRSLLPKGWFLPVTPGTADISVGGAIASDVHGKNHHIDGCFSQWVSGFELLTADGSIVWCSRNNNPELFCATCGGMGLTGIILSAKISLMRVQSAYIRQDSIRLPNLQAVLEAFDRCDNYKYSVAWIDCLARGENMGRSVLFLGEHAESGPHTLPGKARLTMPFDAPGLLLNRFSISMFNETYYRMHPRRKEKELVHLAPFFYPLDSIGQWNRMYGPRGFTQYQLVVPRHGGGLALKKILTRISQSGFGPFLAVLKQFGPENENLLSFPMEGYTLAMDFPIKPGLLNFLEKLDEIVVEHGGRLYLTKDARMSKDVFQKGYPKHGEFESLRRQWGASDVFSSIQSQRLGLG